MKIFRVIVLGMVVCALGVGCGRRGVKDANEENRRYWPKMRVAWNDEVGAVRLHNLTHEYMMRFKVETEMVYLPSELYYDRYHHPHVSFTNEVSMVFSDPIPKETLISLDRGAGIQQELLLAGTNYPSSAEVTFKTIGELGVSVDGSIVRRNVRGGKNVTVTFRGSSLTRGPVVMLRPPNSAEMPPEVMKMKSFWNHFGKHARPYFSLAAVELTSLPELVANEVVVDLGPLLKPELDAMGMDLRILNAFGYDSETGTNLYALPVMPDMPILVYRRDLFDDETHQTAFQAKHDRSLAEPTTVNEMVEVAEYFSDATDVHGLVLPLGRERDETVMLLQWLVGSADVVTDVAVLATNEVYAAAVTSLKGMLAYSGGRRFNSEAALYSFMYGRSAMAVVWMSQVDGLESMLGEKLGVVELPAGVNGRVVPLRGFGLSMPRRVTGDSREQAVLFLKWWMSQPTQVSWQRLHATVVDERLNDTRLWATTVYYESYYDSLDFIAPAWGFAEGAVATERIHAWVSQQLDAE